ncbi:MAG: glycosyltransferase [Pseudomonadota bacterium]
MKAVFAIPGDLSVQSGGYAYARRLLREAPGQGVDLEVQALPDGYPHPSARALADTAKVMAMQPDDRVLLIDGLAYGAMTDMVLRHVPGPVVALCHHPLALETGISPDRAAELKRTERMALAMAEHVITTSHATASILTRDFGVSGSTLTVAQPGTDAAPRAQGSGKAACQIIAVGSIIPRKGHDRLVYALAGLADLDWQLRIIGAQTDSDALAEVEQAIRASDLQDRVTLTGPMDTAEVTAAYQSADLFVLASEYEGFGMAFAEAMAHGLPVLGIEQPAVEEATAGAAHLVDADDLAPALRTLIDDANARKVLAERCWIAAQTLMRWPQTAAIIARVLRDAVR